MSRLVGGKHDGEETVAQTNVVTKDDGEYIGIRLECMGISRRVFVHESLVGSNKLLDKIITGYKSPRS
jgi:hypothetical protein